VPIDSYTVSAQRKLLQRISSLLAHRVMFADRLMSASGQSRLTRNLDVRLRHRAFANAHGGAEYAWVHAYLHRMEGDIDNARYWYPQARRALATGHLEAEWSEIAAALLQSNRP
jgi:hypothetical protein